jgi:large subunit ribosomal protein L23
MDLTIYDIIRGPVITDKSSKLISMFNKVVLNVHPHANKPMIKGALEKLFKVEVKDIKIVVRKGKLRTYKRIKSTGPLIKRAIVTLKPGYTLDMGEPAAKAEDVGSVSKEITTKK